MNKKGFTLVELLAVIIILSLLALIANSSVTNVVSNSKSDLYNAQIKLIETAAENWGVDNLNKLPETDKCSYITLKDLKDYGMFEEKIINPKTNEEFSNDLIIKITSKTNQKGELVSNYEVNPNNIKNCTYAYPPVCTLVNDADSSGTITAGDMYNCKVKEEMEAEHPNGYTFYVLTTPKGDTVDFIMNQNINSDGTPAGTEGVTQSTNPEKYNLVAWSSKSDYGCVDCAWDEIRNDKGPITAIQFLHNATKSWTNVPSLNYEYKDREYQGITEDNIGYTSFKSTNGISNITPLSLDVVTIGTIELPLRARMPIYSVTYDGEGNKILETEKGELANLKEDNSNAYLYDNLLSNGYWTFSSNLNHYNFAWHVAPNGGVHPYGVHYEDSFGIRPVITLPKRLISN